MTTPTTSPVFTLRDLFRTLSGVPFGPRPPRKKVRREAIDFNQGQDDYQQDLPLQIVHPPRRSDRVQEQANRKEAASQATPQDQQLVVRQKRPPRRQVPPPQPAAPPPPVGRAPIPFLTHPNAPVRGDDMIMPEDFLPFEHEKPLGLTAIK